MFKALSFRFRFFFGFILLIAGAMASMIYIYNKLQIARSIAAQGLDSGKPGINDIDQALVEVNTLLGTVTRSVASADLQKDFVDRVKKLEGFVTDASANPGVLVGSEEAAKVARRLASVSEGTMQDLFARHRNIKSMLFSVYRSAVVAKRFDVARQFGLILTAAESTPYDGAEATMVQLRSRLSQIEGYLASHLTVSDYKTSLATQVDALKVEMGLYLETYQQLSAMQEKRKTDLSTIASLLRGIKRESAEKRREFGQSLRAYVFRSKMIIFTFLFFGLTLAGFLYWTLAARVRRVVAGAVRYMTYWFNPAGTVSTYIAQEETLPDDEFTHLHQALDVSFRKLVSLRREDAMMRRLINVPFLLVDKNRFAVFWNAAFSKLIRVKAFEEMGKVNVALLLPTDAVERCFFEKGPVSDLSSISVGERKVQVRLRCEPVNGTDGEIDYVLVNMQDLSEQGSIPAIEAREQLGYVAIAAKQIAAGEVPAEPSPVLAPETQECLHVLRKLGLEQQESMSVLNAQLHTLMFRVRKEGELKQSIHQRTRKLAEQLSRSSDSESAKKAQRLLDISSASLQLQAQIEDTFKSVMRLSESSESQRSNSSPHPPAQAS
jgi:PAS domain-containing protein